MKMYKMTLSIISADDDIDVEYLEEKLADAFDVLAERCGIAVVNSLITEHEVEADAF